MSERVVVAGAGPIGLATAMLLAADGHEVTVLEKDPRPVPATADEAWETWERQGVAQFRGAHGMHARFRQVLQSELPAVFDRLVALGARRFNPADALPGSLADRSPREGDERFETITGRRPVLEAAFAQVAEDTVGVKVVRGVGVAGLMFGSSAAPRVPHVAGVRCTDGVELEAALVVDAMGRRSKLGEWLVAAGGRPPQEEASDAGFAYYTRHYRSRDGRLPEFRGPLGADVGTLRVLTFPADNDTWTLALVPMAGDAPFKALRHNDTWERVFKAIPHAAHWIDATPVCDVIPMAGVMDRHRRMVVDGEPVATGVLPVGDAWACTNPTAGRGMSIGVSHAVVVRDALRSSPESPAQLVASFDQLTEETLTPWFRDQFVRDQHRAASHQALIEGRDALPATADPLARLMAGAATDPDIARAALEAMTCLALPQEVVNRPGIRERLGGLTPAAPPAGPMREHLIAAISA